MEYLESVSGDSFCVLKKTWEGSEVLLVFHTGAETAEHDMSGIMVNGAEISDFILSEYIHRRNAN